MVYTVDGGSSGRDVRRYSAFQAGAQEDERLLPCGTAFVVKAAEFMGPDLLMVAVRQMDDFLIQPDPEPEPELEPDPEPLPEPEPEPGGIAADALLSEHTRAVRVLREVVGCAEVVARQLLTTTSWDVDKAVGLFYMLHPGQQECSVTFTTVGSLGLELGAANDGDAAVVSLLPGTHNGSPRAAPRPDHLCCGPA